MCMSTPMHACLCRCECVEGYTGKQCEDEILECASDPCQNGGKCEDLINSFTCHCKDGYTGVHCESGTSAGCPANQAVGIMIMMMMMMMMMMTMVMMMMMMMMDTWRA